MAANDVLSDVFASLRLHGGVYFRAELSGAWAIEVPAERRRIRFHLVRRGDCWAQVGAEGEPLRLMEEVIQPMAAPLLSSRMTMRPMPETSKAGRRIFPPADSAWVARASTSSTAM